MRMYRAMKNAIQLLYDTTRQLTDRRQQQLFPPLANSNGLNTPR